MSATSTRSRRADAGFWSSASSFFLPVGQQIDPDGVRGYPIDLRVKAHDLVSDPRELMGPDRLHVVITQYGLGCFERWLAEGDERLLEAALVAADELRRTQAPDGCWYHDQPFPHTFRLPPPWASGITQGQAASLFTRLHVETGDKELADVAHRALLPLATDQADGGVRGELGGRPWPEEYPTTPQSHVLNGAIFAIWGLRDVAVGLRDDSVNALYEAALDSLIANLGRYDTGRWSLYSLFPHPIRNRASSFYHDLHINQLTAMQLLRPHREFAVMRDRWAAYAASRSCRAGAFAWKAGFRILLPRNPRYARLTPWAQPTA